MSRGKNELGVFEDKGEILCAWSILSSGGIKKNNKNKI